MTTAPGPDRIGVVVVAWNGGEDVLRCVRALLAEAPPPALDVIVVDNGSTDGSPEALEREAGGRIVLVRNATNLGYCEGNNAGIRLALEKGCDAVILLNDDAFVEAGAVRAMAARLMEIGGSGVVGPKIVYADRPGVLWAAGGALSARENVGALRGTGTADSGRFDRSEEVDFVPGCALLASRDVFERAGLLDPAYFAYFEDVDLCLRAREKGFRIVYEPAARVLHRASRSTGGGYNPRRKYLMGLNSVRFLKRHGSFVRWLRFAVFDVLLWPVAVATAALRGEAAGALAKGRGILDGLRGKAADARAASGGAAGGGERPGPP